MSQDLILDRLRIGLLISTFHNSDLSELIKAFIRLILIPLYLIFQLKQSKVSLSEHLPIVLNARTNLLRFIKYKEAQVS